MPLSAGNIITAPQTITGAWADLGLEIETLGYSYFTAWLDVDINDSKGVEIRVVGVYDSGGKGYDIPLQKVKKDRVLLGPFPFELELDVDQDIIVPIEMDQTYPLIKWQIRAGTVGATAGIITAARYTQGYRQ